MGFLQSPRLLFLTRCSQLGFAVGFLVVVAYANTHKAWWLNMTDPVVLGVLSFIFTLGIVCHAIFVHVKTSYSPSKAVTMSRIVLEFIVMLMWVGSATLMLHRSGDREDGTIYPIGTLPPVTSWDIGIAFSFVEIVAFAFTTFLIVMGMLGRSSGGATTASYV